MARTTKRPKTPATPGFAIEIKDDTELGLAILVAVYAGGGYRPIGVAVSISEAREIADNHRRHYTGAAIEKYELWAQGPEGDYARLESRRAGVPPMPIRRRIENRLSWLTALCLVAGRRYLLVRESSLRFASFQPSRTSLPALRSSCLAFSASRLISSDARCASSPICRAVDPSR